MPGCRQRQRAGHREPTAPAAHLRRAARRYLSGVHRPEVGGKADRTEFKALLLEAYQQKFDLVVFWRLDRFSREGTLATLRYLKELKDHGVNYKSYTEPYLDSLGPFGDVIVSMLVTIAAQDLVKISKNTKAALAKKKAAGMQLGAPTKDFSTIDQLRRLKASGASN
jgi:DNA invertase Pin-like site-specific DNA recombinase